MSNNKYLFVGERPSATAIRRGWKWKDGRLAAKQLFDALRASKIDPESQQYDNLFVRGEDRVNHHAVGRISSSRLEVVAMGLKVSRALAQIGIRHKKIPHPAARGTIRTKQIYAMVVGWIL